MIILDCEATGLPEPSATSEIHHPYMAELTMLKVNDGTLKVLEERTWMIRPRVLPVPEIFTKITGITTAMLEDKPSFAAVYPEIAEFCVGEREWVAHNASYDCEVMRVELDRIGRVERFPWPITVTCTMEETQHRTGKYLKLTELYEQLFKTPAPPQEHRSRSDTLLLLECVRGLRAEAQA